MDAQTLTERRENTRLGDIANRSEKGTALTLIRAETRARDEKTARLKALRLAQEAEGGVSETAVKKPARRVAAPRAAAKKPARARKA